MASEGDKYVTSGVWLRCDKGAAPGMLKTLPKPVQLYGTDWATQFDAVPLVNIPTFGACLVTHGPCMPVTVMWANVMESVSVLGQSPLLDVSTCQCTVGGSIKIFFTQLAALSVGTAPPLSPEDAAAEQEAKEDALFWGNVGKGLLIAAAVVGTAAIIIGTGGGALVVLGAAAATGAAVGGVGGAVAGGISGGPEGAVEGFFQGAAYGALGGIAVASGAGVVAGALAVGAAGAGVASLGFLGKAYYHNPSKENGLVLVGAGAGMLAGGLTGRGAVRLQQMRANAKPVQLPPPPPNLKQLVDEAHNILGKDTQRYKTTAIGRDADGKLYIASSDERVPPAQRDWAAKNGVTPVKGVGHAEETIINNVKDVKHIEPSRAVCLDCENLMNQNKVTTTAPKTGKRSRNRIPKASSGGKTPKKRKNPGSS